MKQPRVAAYITSYEDSDALQACLSSINHQTYPVEEILIVDNSLIQISVEKDIKTKIVIQHYPHNIGISGGLAKGLEWAINRGHDFLWTFDQDSQPTESCLELLINEYAILENKGELVGLIAPLPLDSNTHIELPGAIFRKYRYVPAQSKGDKAYECDMAITSGSLVALSAAKATKMPEVGLFIDAVDWDYCMKLKESGHKVFMTRKAIMNHRFSDMKLVKLPLLDSRVVTNNYVPIRRYYMCRNHTYMSIKLAKLQHIPIVILHRFFYLLYSSAKILLLKKRIDLKRYG